MITRFDHAIIAVRDLDGAAERYRAAGFEVQDGGQHPGRGTANAIVRFGLDYLELITVQSAEAAIAAGGNSRVTAELLAEREGGVLGYALATNDIVGLAARLADLGVEATGPLAGERLRPDGQRLDWRLLIPFGTSWSTPWPMFIQWNTTEAERLSVERPGNHPNGVMGVAGMRVRTDRADLAEKLLGTELGLVQKGDGTCRAMPSGDCSIEVATGGEAVDEVRLRARDLERVQLRAGGLLEGDRLELPAEDFFGARIAVLRG
ncbi:MAG: VOC family protein [Candidatus Dormibacteraeota bacterium]|nr:VOC family protein [Candidatus Dormibacteraeota bacterium]MBO0703903.1 VOC family protein [Candidatus Dormibacteraeota bacterium]MBO0762120.1 VOC family protein [Candidatus Dormibacteraeota bacterium]